MKRVCQSRLRPSDGAANPGHFAVSQPVGSPVHSYNGGCDKAGSQSALTVTSEASKVTAATTNATSYLSGRWLRGDHVALCGEACTWATAAPNKRPSKLRIYPSRLIQPLRPPSTADG